MKEKEKMLFLHKLVLILTMVLILLANGVKGHRILVDTDMDTDDFFALFYLLKLNTSQMDLKAITISTNGWTDAGHAVNQVYDMLYMMGRDDIAVGMGGEGGILPNGTILPDVGGYLPIIDQGNATAGYCRYRQAIPVGPGGRLDIDSNFGFRKSFLPQGKRHYSPLRQPTVQQVMINTISSGPTVVFLIASHTNFALFLLSNPHLKKNVEHIYIMGGGVRSKNPTGCFPQNVCSSCQPQQCGDIGNLFTDYTSNPYAEFNFFMDPFAAYQVIHSGIPVTLVPLDATNTIPVTEKFIEIFEKNQYTYEAQYCFKSLKMARDTWFDDQFNTSYFMWDSFMSGVAASIMQKQHNQHGENEFAEMEYINITVVTSNKPYGISDGSNPIFDGHITPKFSVARNEVHSGHVQTKLRDPFCIEKNRRGRCQDGYTKEVSGSGGVPILVAIRAKPNRNANSELDREFFVSFLDVINKRENAGRFNFSMQFPYYRKVLYKPDFRGKQLGKNIVFDMDMSAGDFLALFYLLKLPIEEINLKAIIVSPTGWANAATIDSVYDLLHMMGRDDIPVGLGDVFAMNQSDPIFYAVGDCKYNKVIPQGCGGFLDSDTLYGLSRSLPRSPRRYTAENSVKYGVLRDTDHPELRQPLALKVWESAVKSLKPGSKITILTNGPLTNIAKIVLAGENMTKAIQDIIIVGGHMNHDNTEKGNVINVPSNRFAELNMFLDPLAAQTVLSSDLNITLIPLGIQQKVSAFSEILEMLNLTKRTPEAIFARRLLSRLHHLKKRHPKYQHMDTFLGEILGAVVLAGDHSVLESTFGVKNIKVTASGYEAEDGQILIDEKQGKSVRVLENLDPLAYYNAFANRLGDVKQSAIVGSFDKQRRIWNTPFNRKKTAP
ncbi:nucleoside hydrolase 4-like [Solanum verrucosum]|uniref:nucleoside hydrolase 4-like n=1 Tax=Solanum verrucosum TaxID=315347 RepID=UPI0020D07AFC|nr:nucleoside hydrolase 4-like [Solanum verrucosum]